MLGPWIGYMITQALVEKFTLCLGSSPLDPSKLLLWPVRPIVDPVTDSETMAFQKQNLLITIWNNPASGGPASQLGGFYFLPLASSLPNIGNHYMTERPLCVEFSTYNQQYSHIKPLLAGCILFNNMTGEVGLNFM